MSKNQFEKESCEVALEENNSDLYYEYKENCTDLKPFWDASTPPGYTYHGERHIKMVVQYVGRLLGSDRIKELTDEELFILLMGAACHDVGMSKYTAVGRNYIPDRENHNINSYLKVYDPSDHKAGSLGIKVPSNNPIYNELIALLCLGHRDHEENNKKICTLTEEFTINGEKIHIPETESLPDNSKVHVRYLASILRLADEIDVTNQRAPRDVEMHLKDFITDEAKKHWCAHQLIKEVRIDHNPTEHGDKKIGTTDIYLVPDVKEIKARSKDEKQPIAERQLLRLVFSRRKKIEEEISIINTITNKSCLGIVGLAVEYRVHILFDNEVVTRDKFEIYQKDVDKQQEEENSTSPHKAMDGIDSELVGREKSPVELFNDEVIRLKRDHNLLETGSFSFSFAKGGDEYTQYFINTQQLLTNRSTLGAITEIFKDHYCTKNIDCVIGIGKAGIILAPNLSLKLNCNCSYLICDWEDTASVDWEKRVSVISTAENVLMILDVVSTGTATKQGIAKIKEKNNTDLKKIYIGAVFCTNKTIKEKIKEVEKVEELFSINDAFQFRTYSQEEYEKDKEFKKEFELLPLRKK